jgi:predicted ester cyclase
MSKPGWILVVVALSLSLSACLTADIPPSNAANKDVVRNYIERVINEEDWSAWPDLFGDTVSFNGQTMSMDDVKTMTAAFRSILPDFHMTVESQIAEGDTVATRVSISGTHQGDYMGIEATGKHVTFRGLAYDRIVDGKVVEMWHEMDLWGTLLMLDD